MRRSLLLTVAALCAIAALAVAGAVQAASKVTTLNGTDGPGFTITLKKGAAKVTSLKAGSYKIVVNDKSNIHNFHLTGPGVNKKTSVAGKGTTTWTVNLKKGVYKYVCDPHATTMKGSFKVT
jgi:plastocyanin